MNIISASRRTDIPAFYSDWFMNRIREGYVHWMNPFSKAVYRVSLKPEMVGGRIRKAHCIDPSLLSRLFPDSIGAISKRPTREECGCYESKDIGAYNTCPHGCIYCYANTGKDAAMRSHANHDPQRDALL